MTNDFTNLYSHGIKMNTVAKRYFSLFKTAVEEDNEAMILQWGECFRKQVMEVVSVAKTVLSVEELIKGKPRKFT